MENLSISRVKTKLKCPTGQETFLRKIEEQETIHNVYFAGPLMSSGPLVTTWLPPILDGPESPGGGVTTIYIGTGCANFWGAFSLAENEFWGIVFGNK